jgi:hypothetical protein
VSRAREPSAWTVPRTSFNLPLPVLPPNPEGALIFDRPDHVDRHGFFSNPQVEPDGKPERRLPH